jgi:hypothetical protein
LAADGAPTAARAVALNHAAIFAIEAGDVPAGKTRAEEGLALHLELGDAWGVAHSSFLLAHVIADAGDAIAARDLFAECLRQFRGLGDAHHTRLARSNLANVVQELGDLEQARALTTDEAVALALGSPAPAGGSTIDVDDARRRS